VTLLLLLMSQMVFSKDVTLVDITNDEDDDITKVGIMVNDNTGEAELLYKKVVSHNNEVLTFDKHKLETVAEGVTFVKRGKREIVKMKLENIHPSEGADIILDYLYSGISGERKKEDLAVDRVGEDWIVRMDGKKVKSLHFKSNKKLLIGTIGIKDVVPVKTYKSDAGL
jgi:hypothetical protein